MHMRVPGCREVHVFEKGFWECEASVHSRRRRAGARAGSRVCTARRGRGVSARGCEGTDGVCLGGVCAAGAGEEGHVWREKGVNTAGSGRGLPGVRVAGTPGPACGAGWELLGGERHSETFERRQTLPLSTLTPTISPKKAVNPLLPGQARGKVSADSQLPSLPRLIPFGQVTTP